MILITGAKGQLGYDFQKLFDSLRIQYTATDADTLNITDSAAIEKFFSINPTPEIIINCAAYNNVDKAESETEVCKKLNCLAPIELAKYAKKIGCTFVTYSTDFVFDGLKNAPYTEEDKTNPLSVYAKTKRDGEIGVLAEYDKVFVIRTSWVFGIANKNFNTQAIEWSKAKNELNIVTDQISAPTYSKDLASSSWQLINSGKFGLYHITNQGECSKYDQAAYLLNKIGWNGRLNKAQTKNFPTPAKRSSYTKLSCKKLENAIGYKMPSWQNAIDRYIDALKEFKKL